MSDAASHQHLDAWAKQKGCQHSRYFNGVSSHNFCKRLNTACLDEFDKMSRSASACDRRAVLTGDAEGGLHLSVRLSDSKTGGSDATEVTNGRWWELAKRVCIKRSRPQTECNSMGSALAAGSEVGAGGGGKPEDSGVKYVPKEVLEACLRLCEDAETVHDVSLPYSLTDEIAQTLSMLLNVRAVDGSKAVCRPVLRIVPNKGLKDAPRSKPFDILLAVEMRAGLPVPIERVRRAAGGKMWAHGCVHPAPEDRQVRSSVDSEPSGLTLELSKAVFLDMLQR